MSKEKQLAEILGIPEELVNAAVDLGIPSINNQATGGTGGRAINLTYVDNYSTLLLVYTFLLQTTANQSASSDQTNLLNQSLLKTLEMGLNDQKEYRKQFLHAIELLKQ